METEKYRKVELVPSGAAWNCSSIQVPRSSVGTPASGTVGVREVPGAVTMELSHRGERSAGGERDHSRQRAQSCVCTHLCTRLHVHV